MEQNQTNLFESPTELMNVNTASLKAAKQMVEEEANQEPIIQDEPIIDQVEVEQPKEEKREEPKDLQGREEVKFDDSDVASHLDWLKQDETNDVQQTDIQQDGTGAPEKISGEIPKEYLEAKQAYEEITKNPIFKALEGYFRSGNTDITEFVNLVGAPDYEKVYANGDYATIYKEDLIADGLTEDEIEQAMSDFEMEPTYKQKKMVKPIVDKLQKKSREKIESLTDGFYTTEKEQRKYMDEVAVKAVKELEGWVEKTTDKMFYGMKVTPEVADLIKKEVMTEAVLTPDGRGYDIPKSIRVAVAKNDRLFKKLLLDNMDLARTEGYEEALRDRVRPNRRESSPGGGNPSAKRDISRAISNMGIVKEKSGK